MEGVFILDSIVNLSGGWLDRSNSRIALTQD
jgi:hypothetical protein